MDLLLFFLVFQALFLVGDKIRRLWHLPFSGTGEAFLFCSALGWVALSYTVTVLAFLNWVYPVVAWLLLILIHLISAPRLSQIYKSLPLHLKSIKTEFAWPPIHWFDLYCSICLLVLIILAVTLALTPPIMTDALVYHLAAPKTYLENHGITNLPNNIYSYFPQLIEMVYLYCLALGGDTLARLSGLGMVLLLLLSLALFFKRKFSSRYALFVPVLYFSTPTFFLVSSSAYIDTQTAAFVFLSFYAWDSWKERRHDGWFFLMVLFAASATASKLTAIIVPPLAFLGILLNSRKERPTQLLMRIGILAGTCFLLLAPWWGRNYAFTGNPLAPYFLQFLGGEDRFNWDAARSGLQQIYYNSFGMGHGLKEFLLLPVNLTFFSEKDSLRFDGEIGILYFLLIPTWFWLRRRDLPAVTVFFILLVFWFAHFQYVRTLTPSFIFLALLSGAGLERMTTVQSGKSSPSVFNWRRFVPVGLSMGMLFNLGLITHEWQNTRPLPYLLGQESRSQFWTRHIPAYPLFQTANETLAPDSVVLLVYMKNLGYLMERKFISDTFFEAHTLKTILAHDASIEGITKQLHALGATHLMFDNQYVFGKDSAFTPEEREALKDFLNTKGHLISHEDVFYIYSVS